MATPEDLAQTVKAVEALDRRIIAIRADVRDYGALQHAVQEGVTQFGWTLSLSSQASEVTGRRTKSRKQVGRTSSTLI